MKILKLKATNLMLFKSVEINPQHINLAKGINFDSPKDSSNGSGKSTLFKVAILFALYGESCGKKLSHLIRDGEKECSIEIECSHNNEHYKIIRTIPNSLQIFVNEIEKQFNTPTIGQNYLNSIFGDYRFFQKFCLIDDKGINLLDSLDDVRSVVSFKKELIQFITDEFEPIRQSLLDDKNNRELYSVDKKLYHFYLSTKKWTILESGLIKLQEELADVKKAEEEQSKIINDLGAEENSSNSNIEFLTKQESDNLQTINKNKKLIEEYQTKIVNLKNQPAKERIKHIDYDSQLLTLEKTSEQANQELKEIEKIIDSTNKKIEELHFKKHTINTKLEEHNSTKQKINEEIKGLDNVKTGAKCDKCGAIVTEEYKESYRKEKIQAMAKIIEEDKALNQSLSALEEELEKIQTQFKTQSAQKKETSNKIDQTNKQTKSLNTLKFEQAEKIKLQESEKVQIESNIIKYQDLIKTYEEQMQTNNNQNTENKEKIKDLKIKIEVLKTKIKEEESSLDYYKDLYNNVHSKIEKAKEYTMKLKEAGKFSAYKYSKSDVQLYADTIKTLDEFSGFYISEWIGNLSFIINDLLKAVNLSIELTDGKEFIKMKDGKKEWTWVDLSSGQQKFLSAIFKFGILLQKGESDKIIIMDDGLWGIDKINFINLIEICQTLPMQFFIIFQDYPIVENVNNYIIERKNEESNVKKEN